jgi:hypothetical protein
VKARVAVPAKTKASSKAGAKAKASSKARVKKTPTVSKAGAKPKATTAAKPKATIAAKPKATPATKPKARTAGKPKATTAAKSTPGPGRKRAPEAVPSPIEAETSTEAHRRLFTARDRAVRSSPVVEILDDPHPMGALRRFLDSLRGEATPQQAQIALGSAQLMLLPLEREQRGGAEVRELIDLVVRHWRDFGERQNGFHAQEFLKHAFPALGVDRDRTSALEALIPDMANSELLFNLASAHAVARDKVAMLRAVERALEAGASATQFRRDPEFAPYANDPDLTMLLARAEVPAIPVDIEPYLPAVRGALDSLLSTLKEFGESVELRPPVRLDAILDAERAGKVSLPNDYRALLTITNGMRLWEHEFFSAGDYRENTRLAIRAQQYLGSSLGVTGLAECVPLASWGQPTDWLLYDPRGRMRAGEPGYVLMLNTDGVAVDDLAAALQHMETMARDVLGTN